MSNILRDYSFGIIPFYRVSFAEYVFFIGRSQGRDGRHGFWKFPKGHKNPDEDEQDAALRELEEETGIVLTAEALISSVSFKEEYFFEGKSARNPNGGIVRKQNTYWLGQVASGTIGLPEVILDEKEFAEYKWVSFEEATKLLPENSRDFLREAHAFLIENRV